MSNKLTILLIFFLLTSKLNAGTSNDTFSISGSIKILVGNEIFIPTEETIIEINQINRNIVIDKFGLFRFDKLTIGSYKLKISSFGFNDKDTVVRIDTNSINNLFFLFITNCSINRQTAENDIKLNNPRLLLVGSIAPMIYLNQNIFEKKYKIKYFDFGCTPPNNECILQYNRRIFDYLDLQFGKSWRKNVRKDVVGFSDLSK